MADESIDSSSSSNCLQFAKEISNHAAFTELSPPSRDSQEAILQNKKLVTAYDCQVFIWNEEKKNIVHVVNTKAIFYNSGKSHHFQVLKCTKPTQFQVNHIQINNNGSYLALVGQNAIDIMELVYRSDAIKQHQEDATICRNFPLDSSYFNSHPEVEILQCKWHPGSKFGLHLVVLTSHSMLRVYNISKPDVAQVEFTIHESIPRNKSGYFNALSAASRVISFDFGPPIDNDVRMVKSDISSNNDQQGTSETHIHPIYLLQDDGDIYIAVVNLKTKLSYFEGPLIIRPASDDNYGADACSIICLPTKPAVIVIATLNGSIFHAIVTDSESDDEALESTFSVELCAFESVNLDPALFKTGSDDMIDLPDPVILQADTLQSNCYFFLHPSGVHSVLLPWIDNITAIASDKVTQCRVECLICTRSFAESPATPMWGLTQVNDCNLSYIVGLISGSNECVVVPLKFDYGVDVPLLVSEMDELAIKNKSDDQLTTENLVDAIRKVLGKRTSVSKVIGNDSMSQEQIFEILTKTTGDLRKNHLKNFHIACDIIEHRVQNLADRKVQQNSQLLLLNVDVKNMKAEISRLREKYQQAKEKQEEIRKRTRKILANIQSFIPVKADAEEEFHSDITEIDANLKDLRKGVDNVIKKCRYYEENQAFTKAETSSLPERDMAVIHEGLKAENDVIKDLIQKVKDLSSQVSQ
ncbi:Nuclear pore complex protein Nup88 [Trichoplax sp. H2]|nr:Nuclear pore complex protein Nup88 [Trichoplax sp. H2]|eukprot:RDD38044.1 Nuclear pore complex protein Nup88 [Trichoplax sp. H2]